VNELADRPLGGKPANAVPFKNLISLDEIIGEALGVGPKSKKVMEEYKKLIAKFGRELNILLNVSYDEITQASNSRLAEAIKRVREGKVNIRPGYDGEYGKISIFKEEEKKEEKPQTTLF
jgi:DNA helicase-2/ATP-dependent DNA helicase PcrA